MPALRNPQSEIRNPQSDLCHWFIYSYRRRVGRTSATVWTASRSILPPLHVKPTHGEYFPLNIQVKDPLWLQRNLLDFSFSVKPDEARTLWLDTRDRILPSGKGLYLTIAGAGAAISGRPHSKARASA